MGLKWVVFFVLWDISMQDPSPVWNFDVFYATTKAVLLKWDPISGANSYEITGVLKSTSENKCFATFNSFIMLTSIVGLEASTEYTFTIVAKDISGVEIRSASIDSFTAPGRMDNTISANPVDSSTVEVVFTEKPGVTTYIIRILNPADDTFFREEEVTSSPGVITGLNPYTEYEFTIMTANIAGRSQPTLSVTAKTLLSPPLIQSSSSSSSSTIELVWTAVPNADKYTVCLLKDQADESEKLTQETPDPNYTFTSLEPGALYHIEIYGWDTESRKGEYTESTQVTRPPAPNNIILSIVIISDEIVMSVTWDMDPVHGEIQYTLTIDETGQTCTGTSQTCAFPVHCGTEYNVEIFAQNDAGPSVPASQSIITIPCPPENLKMSETSPGSCTFTWDPVTYADEYKAFIKNIDGVEVNCTTEDTSCDFTCECGYTYLMSVFAYNDAGQSQQGLTLNYTTIPCCPTEMNVSLVNPDTLMIEWVKARGAVLYETQACNGPDVILCNDTAPLCVLSSLQCDEPYIIKVIPCSDLSGCNQNCPPHSKDTGLCMPTAVSLNKVDSSTVTVSWVSSNRDAGYRYTATATAEGCQDIQCDVEDDSNNCNLENLLCGYTYEVSVKASSSARMSLPSYTVPYETEPCCPSPPTVTQVTQAMTNVSWSEARGAHTFLTSLTSIKGNASCHTMDIHCLMGCITCGTNYTVTMEVYSVSGLQKNCIYNGFSSSLCCPSGVRIYRVHGNDLRLSWRSIPGSSHTTNVTMTAFERYTCEADPGDSFCDVSGVICGVEYTVVVAPVKADGTKENFCPHRKYGVTCNGSVMGPILFRGKRSMG